MWSDAKGGTLDLTARAPSRSRTWGRTPSGTRAWTKTGSCWTSKSTPGDFPIQIKFAAAVALSNNGWNSVDFQVAQSALQPVVCARGWGRTRNFNSPARRGPSARQAISRASCPPDSRVKLAWKEARAEAEGKLFYAAEMLSQISVSPGLMRQAALLDFKVMQGELNRVTLRLRGAGEVTRVQGDQVLAWSVEPGTNSADRRLVVQLNQPQKDQFAFQVQAQTPLGAFPQTADVLQLRPEGSTRSAGYFRIVNEGAVRLYVAHATGLSQISPEQFPETEATKAMFRATGAQRFAYRFSGADFALRVQADQILPELSASEVLAYHLGESELAIDAEIELDIREAPLRELLLRIPKGYALSPPTAPGLSDYFTSEPPGDAQAELRIVYGQPVSGRQVIQLRMERNQALGGTNWDLPRIDVATAKSVRGYVGVSADAGFRLTPGATHALTDVATAFFPRKVAGLQTAFRLNDPAWEATLRVERLPQSVLADVFHLFSIGEGIAYGSSVMNYTVSGAPVPAFRVELSDEYFNVEFTGKDIRNWQKTDGGYVVQLHTPVAGPYTLLATYERPFKAQGETLGFTGARPLDAQSEQGHTLIISAYQFQVKPGDVSAGLLPLEPAEVPPEYRLFFDAPILAAYHYTSRPFNLKLALSPLAQGDSLSQVVDRASLTTRISKEGQVLTDVRYFVKNRGNPNFRLTLPDGVQLWSATVNGKAVVPVIDAKSNLIPLPQRADPNAILTLDLKLASRSLDAGARHRRRAHRRPRRSCSRNGKWNRTPDGGSRLSAARSPRWAACRIFRASRNWRACSRAETARMQFVAGHGGVGGGLGGGVALGGQQGVLRFSARHLAGTIVERLAVFALAIVLLFNLRQDLARDAVHTYARRATSPSSRRCNNPAAPLSVEVANVPEPRFGGGSISERVARAGSRWSRGFNGASGGAGFKSVALDCSAGRCWPGQRSARRMARRFFGLVVGRVPAVAGGRSRVAPPVAIAAQTASRRPTPPAWRGRAAAATVCCLIVAGLVSGCASAAIGRSREDQVHLALPHRRLAPNPSSQQIRVEDKFVFGTAKIHWQAEKGQTLPAAFRAGGVDEGQFSLARPEAGRNHDRLAAHRRNCIAQENGAFDIEVQYQNCR